MSPLIYFLDNSDPLYQGLSKETIMNYHHIVKIIGISTKARSRVVFGRVTRRTWWLRIVGSCENLPGYPLYKDYRDLC